MLLGKCQRITLTAFPPAGRHLPTGCRPGSPIQVPFQSQPSLLPARLGEQGAALMDGQRYRQSLNSPSPLSVGQQSIRRLAKVSSLQGLRKTQDCTRQERAGHRVQGQGVCASASSSVKLASPICPAWKHIPLTEQRHCAKHICTLL